MSGHVFEGGCLCGAVRYRAEGAPTEVCHCHCATCRRAAAAPMVTWVTFEASHFGYPTGRPRDFRSSPAVTRTFCSACGTPLTYQRADRHHEIDVTVCSLDEPEGLVPRAHIWTAQQLSWLGLDDGLPHHERERNEP